MSYLSCDHDFHRDWGWPAPKIVVLCGSTRFIDTFRAENLRLTLAGHIVLSIGCDTKSDDDLAAAGQMTDELKARLDELHLRKIDLADGVMVLNVGGYIGESTRREIEYAHLIDKPVAYLEDVGERPQAPRPPSAPEHVYRAVAEQRAIRFGYDLSLDSKELDQWKRAEVRDMHVRMDADVVWALAAKHFAGGRGAAGD